jgi:hypothetical protein
MSDLLQENVKIIIRIFSGIILALVVFLGVFMVEINFPPPGEIWIFIIPIINYTIEPSGESLVIGGGLILVVALIVVFQFSNSLTVFSRRGPK